MSKSEADLKKDFDSFVEKALPAAKVVALSELIGGNYLLKKEYKFNPQGHIISEKYVPIAWDNEPEVLEAINSLLSKETHELGDDYFVLSQRPPSHRFWESLLARTIGKPIEQLKVEQNVNMYSETVAKARERLKKTGAVPSPLSDWV